MRQFHVGNVVLIALFPFFAAAASSAVTPDAKLLSLVPPGAQIVAGMSAPLLGDRPDSFLLITRDNTMDLRDFFALSGVDSSRIIHQVIFVASGDHTGKLEEHSLLISGQFDKARIFKAAVENGASISEYMGVRVLVVQPLERDRRTSKNVRWLTMAGSNVALFGTIASVQQELDRHLAHSVADLSLIQKLARLRRDDETWCVMAAFVHNYETRRALSSLDAMLADPAHDGDAFQFGIHYGRHVEFEYEITATSSASAQAMSLPGPDMTGDGNTVRGVIKVSMNRYNEWLAEVSALDRVAAASHREKYARFHGFPPKLH